MKRAIIVLFVLVALAAGGAAGTAWWFVNTPASTATDEIVLEIPKGSGAVAISEQLFKAGLVKNALGFRLYVKFKKAGNSLRAGEFAMRRDVTPGQALDIILKGEVLLHKITVPPGFTAKEVAAVVGASGLANEDEFLRLCEDPAFARGLGLPADRLEGYLFPETYSFEKGAGARVIATTMVRHFQAVWTPELAAKAKALGLDTHQAVTLASIVEKETGVPDERPLIAGLFYNRLAKRMRLETDPTIIYGMKDYHGAIHAKDIHDPSNVYNTYVIYGLPPGPIAQPGAEALRAVAEPVKSDWLYFVASGHGGHMFAATLQEHNRNVQKYLNRIKHG